MLYNFSNCVCNIFYISCFFVQQASVTLKLSPALPAAGPGPLQPSGLVHWQTVAVWATTLL